MFSGRLWNIFIDSFPKMLLRALTGTIPLTVIAFALAMVIAKDTSLASCITVPEMLQTTKQIVAVTYESLLLYAEVGLIYLIISTILTKLQSIGEKKLNFYGRKEG